MRIDSLLSPGQVSNGYKLRLEAAKAISQAEMLARNSSGGKTSQAAKLSAFFADCVTKLASYVEVVLPTVVSRVRTNATTATITMSEALSPSTSVPLSAFTIGARVLSAVVVTGSTIVITGVGITAADVVTYTPPTNGSADLGVKDLAGNLVATFTGALA